MRWRTCWIEGLGLDGVAGGLGQDLLVGGAGVVALVGRGALEPVRLGQPVGDVGIGRGQTGVGHLGIVLDGGAGGVHGARPVGHVLGDPCVVGHEGADVLAQARPAGPDGHAVRERALLVLARTRGEGEGARSNEHK